MNLTDTLSVAPLILSALITVYLAVQAWQHRPTPGATHLTGLMVCVSWWLVAYSFEAISTTIEAKFFWVYLQYAGLVLIPVFWFAFVLEYTGFGGWLSVRNLIMLLIVPAITLLLIWTNPLHHWAWSSYHLDEGMAIPDLHVTFGWVLWLNIVYSAILILSALALLTRSVIRQPPRRSRIALFIIGAGILLVAITLDILDKSPLAPLSMTPFAVVGVGIIIALGISRLRVLDIIPLAREVVLESMSDGVLVLDIGNRIADLNLAASEIIGCTPVQALGRQVMKVWPAWPGEMTLPLGQVEIVKEVSMSCPEGICYYDLRISSLVDQQGHLTGRLAVLRDVTRQKRTEEALRRRDEILEAISFAAEQFLRQSNWEHYIQDVLSRLGEATGVSRISIYENREEANRKLICNHRHEWAAWGVQPLINATRLQNLSLDDPGFSRWTYLMSRGQIFTGSAEKFLPPEQALLADQGVRSIAIVPIFLAKIWWGFIEFIDCNIDREWTGVEVDALRAAANTIGAAIQRERTEAEVRRWTDVISTMLSLTEIIGSTMNIPKVLDQVVLAARSLLPVERVAVFLWDEKEQTLAPAQSQPNGKAHIRVPPDAGDILANLHLSPQQLPLVKELQEKQRPIALHDATSSQLIPPQHISEHGIRSLLAVPIVFQERFVGVLYADCSDKPHTFTEQEVDLATALARQAALAIERGRLYAQSQQDAAELAALYRASTQLLNPGHDLKALAEQIVHTVIRDFEAAYCSVLWLDQERKCLQVLADYGQLQVKEVSLPLDGPGLTVYAAKHKEIVYVPDVSQDERYVEAAEATRSEMALPLHVGDAVFGVLNLESPEPNAFDERTRRILAAFADDASLALQNTRLFNAAERHSRQLTLLNEITATALSVSDFAEMLQALADKMITLINSDECFITLWDEEHQRVMPGAASGKMREQYNTIAPELGEATITAAVLEAGHSITIEDTSNTPYLSPRLAAAFPTVSILGLPMIADGQKIGAVLIGFYQCHYFTRAEVWLCEQVSVQVALAISRAWSREVSLRRAQEANNLRLAISAITSSLDLRQVLDNILIHLEEVVPYDSSCIFLLEMDHLRAVAGRGFPNQDVVMGASYPVDVLYQEIQSLGQLTILADAQADERFQEWGQASDVRGWMGVPLHGRGTAIGYLTLDSRKPNAFDERSAALAQAFANQAAVAIENSQLYENARRSAQEAETLRQAGAIVAQTLQEEEAIQLIMQQLEHVVPYDSASVQLLRNGYLEIVGVVGFPDREKILGMRFPIPGDNPNTVVVQNRQPHILGNAAEVYANFRDMAHGIQSWLGIPLIVHEGVIGILAIDSCQPNYFTQDHARLASAFGDQVAIAIENARLFAEEQKRVQQLDALRATGADISVELDLTQLLQTILKRAVVLLDATGGELGICVEGQDALDVVASHNMGRDFTGTRIMMGEGAMGWAADSLQPLIIQNYHEWEGQSPQYQDGPWQAVMAAPMLVHGKLVGAIAVMEADQARHFAANDLQLLTMFAQQSGIAVENARLYQEARRAAERRAILHQVTQEVVSASFEPEKVYQAIHRAAQQLMPAEAFAITLVTESQQDVQAVYLIDQGKASPPMRIPTGSGLSGKVISTGKTLRIDDVLKVNDFAGIHYGTAQHTRSILAVPLRTSDRVIGMIAVQSYQPNAYMTEDQHLLEMLAANAAIAIDNARLLREIQWLAITDPLTGIFNRRGLFDKGLREVDRLRRFKHPFSAIMLDIDHFKQINDTYGHAAGDQVLVALAKNLTSQIRADVDIIGRYGGEELVVLLPETNVKGAIKVAERLRRQIEKTPVLTDRGEISITISLGVAEFKSDTPDLATLLDRADSAMYFAKQGGRNQTKAYSGKSMSQTGGTQ